MFACEKCGGKAVTYDHMTHAYVCPDCGDVEALSMKYNTCPRCGALVAYYTWFDPSGCSQCGRSFVD